MPSKNEKYMKHCLKLAIKGLENVASNPMVGSVIVVDDKVIGTGYHQQYGGAHAEVNAINSVLDKKLLKRATLYVNLEPCSHFGKTPPCADLIIKYKIPRVVIGCVDASAKVNGRGIKKLKKAGIDVRVNVLENECQTFNKKFFTYHQKKRPYIILKWAQTSDYFIDAKRNINSAKKALGRSLMGEAIQISNRQDKILTHKLRNQMQAIMVGTNTALLDNPYLTTREVKGKNPLRITIDRDFKIPRQFNLLDKSTPTVIFTARSAASEHNLEFVKINFKKNILPQILNKLYKRKIQSVLIEGGAQLLNSFIKNNLWDEMRIFTAMNKKIKDGIKAPVININLRPTKVEKIGSGKLRTYLDI